MSPLLKTSTTIFDDTSYETHEQFFQDVKKIKRFLARIGISENSVCVINLDCPKLTIKTLFAIFSLKAIAAMMNFKHPLATQNRLLDDLGPYQIIDQVLLDEFSNDETLNLDHEKISILIATSGSSGHPKWIASTLDHWIKSALGSIQLLNVKSYENFILSLPLFHVSGLAIVFRAFLSHASLIITKSYDYLERARYSLIPLQLERLVEADCHHQLAKTQSILVGGGKLEKTLFEKTKNLPVYITYGMTECQSQVTSTQRSPHDLNEGKPLAFRDIKINSLGQILIKGECVSDFQFQKGALMALKDEDGFYNTKDCGFFDDNMNLHILGRLDERIEINGEKIYPSQIEATLKNNYCFKKLCVTHIVKNRAIKIIAFAEPIPKNDDLENLKKATGSLFFPKIFLNFPLEPDNKKILLSDLKRLAVEVMHGE